MAIVLVCEGPGDNRALRTMIFALLREHHDWLEPEHCGFQGLTPSEEFLAWKEVQLKLTQVSKGFGNPPMGHFGGKVIDPYATRARKVLWLLGLSKFGIEAGFVLVCDEDGRDSRRLEGLRQARESSTLAPTTVVGVAKPKMEAWVLAGFEAVTVAEQTALQSQAAKLSFDPTCNPERLRDHQTGADRDIKRVLKVLSDGGHQREARALSSLDRIRQYGRETGAVEFLEECSSRLSPLFGGPTR